MHDISDNVYIVNRNNPMDSYTVDRFLHNELAIVRDGELNDVRIAVYGILLSHGFIFQLKGCDYLALLVERYIVKSDYDEKTALSDIAAIAGADSDFVVGCIDSCVKLNKDFILTASASLSTKISPDKTSVTDVVEILGAIFKVYYNYNIYTEHFEEDDIPAINFGRIVFNHGKER